MKLYYAAGTCSLAPHIVMRELGLPHALVKVDTKAGRYDGGDYLQVNGKGYVPAIELADGQYLTETAMMLEYLADRDPDAGLAPPAGSMERYRLREWLVFIATELHKGFAPLFKPDSSDGEKARTRMRLAKRLDWLAQQMKGHRFVMGKAFSVADAYLFTILGWGKWTNIDLGQWPVLQEYSARIAARPMVIAALQAEGLLKREPAEAGAAA